MVGEPLTLPQRIRVFAAIYPRVRLILTKEDALKVAAALENVESIGEALKSVRALKDDFDLRVEKIRRSYARAVRWNLVFSVTAIAWFALILGGR